MTDFTIIKRLFNITEQCGYEISELEVIKNIFGNLPEVFIDYYTELGKDDRLNATQDYLVHPEKFKYLKNNEYLIFYCENQCVCVWGIHKDDLNKKNPPVYISYDQNTWEKESDTLTDFLLAFAHLQAVFALEYGTEEFRTISNQDVELINNNFKRKPLELQGWLGIRFFGDYDDSVIAVMNNGDKFDLIYSSGDKGHFEEMDKVLSDIGTEY